MRTIRIFHRDMLLGLPGELFLGVMGPAVRRVPGLRRHTLRAVHAPARVRRSPSCSVRRGSNGSTCTTSSVTVTLVWLIAVGVTGVINTISLPLFSTWRAQVMPELIAPHLGKPPLAKLGSTSMTS